MGENPAQSHIDNDIAPLEGRNIDNDIVEPEDVIVLCKECHRKVRNIGGENELG